MKKKNKLLEIFLNPIFLWSKYSEWLEFQKILKKELYFLFLHFLVTVERCPAEVEKQFFFHRRLFRDSKHFLNFYPS